MAASSGTWLKLPNEKWQFIPPEIRAQANRLDLTWDNAAKLTKFCCPDDEPSEEALFELGEYTGYLPQVKARKRTLLRTRGAHAQECHHNKGPVSYQADWSPG